MQLNRFALRTLQAALASTTLGAAVQPAFATEPAVVQDGSIVVLTRIDRQSAILPEPISVPRRSVVVAVDTSPGETLVETMRGADARVGDVVPEQIQSTTVDVGLRSGRVASVPGTTQGLGAITPRAGQSVVSRIGSVLGNGASISNRTPTVRVPGVAVNVPPVGIDVPQVSVDGPSADVSVPSVSVQVPSVTPVSVRVPAPAPVRVDGILAATDELLAGERLAPNQALGGAAGVVQFATNAAGIAGPAAGATSALGLDGGAAIASSLGNTGGRIADTVSDAVRPISAATGGIGDRIGSTLGTLGARLGAPR
jgi:hypothetical protein